MTTHAHLPTTSPPTLLDRWATARLLVVVQAALLLAISIEALVATGLVGPTGLGVAVLTGLAAMVTLVTAIGLGRHGRIARRWTIVAEAGVIALGVIDVVVTLLLAGDVPLMLLVTRLVLPMTVIALLWRPRVSEHPEVVA